MQHPTSMTYLFLFNVDIRSLSMQTLTNVCMHLLIEYSMTCSHVAMIYDSIAFFSRLRTRPTLRTEQHILRTEDNNVTLPR